MGLSHLVEFLKNKGFQVDNKPTAKISGEMYQALLQEYAGDKQAKQQADKVNIGIGRAISIETKKAEEAAAIRRKVEEEKLVSYQKLADQKKELEKKASEKKAAKEKEEKKAAVPAPEPQPEPEKVKAATPQMEGPRVIGKIELEEKKDDKGKKKTKAKAEPAAPEEKPKAKGKAKKTEEAPPAETETPPAAAETPASPAAPAETAVEPARKEEGPEHVETKFQKIEGFKVQGKIDLSSINEKKGDYSDQRKKNEPRKRIYKTSEKVDLNDVRSFKPKDGEERAAFQKARPQDQQKAGRRRGATGHTRAAEPKPAGPSEITEKEIQEKIKQTLANLSSNTRGKSSKSKYRRLKRDEMADDAANAADQVDRLQVTEFVTVAELASLLNVSVTEIITKCFNLGIIVSINQRLDAEIIELVCHEYHRDVEFISAEEQTDFDDDEEEDDPELLVPRSPIVTIMGHVDHGKTSLLDFIRRANVVAGEKGGITQHIGAYEVVLPNGKSITFLDTPGHEAFTAMRARGAKVTDIAVIVVAAEDSVMPQTKEAISHAQAAGVPMIFAFNKMDKPGANADNIRQQLANLNILVEEWGGKFQTQEISAKTGMNVEVLLDKILLEADMLNLKANPNRNATGSVIEASLDKGRGYTSTLLVQEGTLRHGDIMVAGSFFGKVKALFNERGQKVEEAPPSTPVVVLGLDGAPTAGEKFRIFSNEQDAKELATKRKQILREQGIRTKKHITLDEIGRRLALGNFKELNIIVKADFDGSVEALTDSLLKLSTAEIQVKVVLKGVGQITEGDVLLASASDAIIIGFQVRPSQSARKLAEQEGVDIRLYSIIYNAIEELKSAMEGMLEPKIEEKIVCNLDVREVYKITKVGTVAGCFVTEGKITRQTRIRLVREGIVVYSGELLALKRFKDDVKEVTSGMECGVSIKNFNDIKVGDIVEGYEEVEVKRTL